MKILALGEPDQSKFELITRFVWRMFDDSSIAALSMRTGHATRHVRIAAGSGQPVEVEMDIWDVEFIESMRLPQQFDFRGTNGILGVCNAAVRQSIETLGASIERVLAASGRVPVVLVAVKRWRDEDPVGHDLAEISKGDLGKVAARYNCPHFFTTLSTGENVELAFQTLAELVVRRMGPPAPGNGEQKGATSA